MSTEISSRLIGPKAAKAAILHAIKKRRPIFLHGAPGIGKSDLVAQIGKDTNREVIDVRLALWDPTDIKGVLYYNPVENVTMWSAPPELPSDPNSNAILFLDELNSAPPAVQAAAYQLVLNGRVGTYILPPGVDIVAAGNRDNDRGVTHRMPAPLANRFVHLELTHNHADWQEWAIEHGIHPEVIGWLAYDKQSLYNYKPSNSSKAFCTPRSWSFVSDLLDDEEDIDVDTLHNLVSGAIGDGDAIKFMSHRKIVSKLPKPSDILDGLVTKMEVKEISAMYSLTIGLCYELKLRLDSDVANWDEIYDRFYTFMSNNFNIEIVVMGVRTAMITYKFPMNANGMANWPAFHTKYGKFIIEALKQ